MKKNNGYMLIEIILAFVITFGIVFFVTELVINLKNKNDDILVLSKVKTEQAIIYNKLNTLLQNQDTGFKCDKLDVNNNIITYDGQIITSISNYINLTNDNINCVDFEKSDNKYVGINIDMNILQLPNENLDINLQYNSKKDKSFIGCGDPQNLPIKFNYHDGICEIIDGNTSNWKIRFLTSGYLELGENVNLDVFLVGGGGGGGTGSGSVGSCVTGGGGGGFTSTYLNETINQGTYEIKVGTGGNRGYDGGKSYFLNEIKYVADGGKTPKSNGCKTRIAICGSFGPVELRWFDGQSKGGDGGSGGGSGMYGRDQFAGGTTPSTCT